MRRGYFVSSSSFRWSKLLPLQKIFNKYPDLAVAIDGKKLYSLAFETKLNTKLRELQYKILNLIIFTNKRQKKVQNGGSPLSALIFNAEEESLEHLLYFCKSSSFFGNNCYLG